MSALSLEFIDKTEATERKVLLKHAVIAGWTSSKREALDHHIQELAALGIRPPKTIPTFYRCSTSRVTCDHAIEVLGNKSSGEVEFVLLQTAGRLWVGTGSDHTDRHVEAYNIDVSKQICDHPIARTFWSFDDVSPHWNKLVLRAHVAENGKRVLYQEGSVTEFLSPADLIEKYTGKKHLSEDTIMFCGTCPAIGGPRPSKQFAFELIDPVLGRKLEHHYDIVDLPLNE